VEPERPGSIIGRDFYARETVAVARDLLGCWIVRSTSDGVASGVIVETEAYRGPADQASHARAGRTGRTAPMFGPVGHAYVYLVYGMHSCLNVVAYSSAEVAAGAVLIRALEPRVGLELMRARRGAAAGADVRLAAGPARLCQALDVTRGLDGHDLVAGEGLWLAQGETPVGKVSAGPRIGVDYAGEWAARPWRFWLTGNAAVSRPAG
jgi:DNA-3-methyladenine glycosylase